MKNFLGIVALLLLTSALFARPKADFDKFLKTYTNNVENYPTEKYYEKLEFTKNGEKKKFSDFEEIDRCVYITMKCDLLSNQLEELYLYWKEELKTAEETPDDTGEASKKNINEYLEKLMVLRKKNACKVEDLIDNLFKKWPDKFTKEEKDSLLKRVKEYHDKDKLVERK